MSIQLYKFVVRYVHIHVAVNWYYIFRPIISVTLARPLIARNEAEYYSPCQCMNVILPSFTPCNY